MKVQFVSSVSVIAADPPLSRRLYVDALGLPLEELADEYYASEKVGGSKHFGVWPLTQAAQACFGTPNWPDEVTVPQVSIEFELGSPAEVAEGAQELEDQGYVPLHATRTEPWGQTVARVLSPEGSIVGLSYAPWQHESDPS
jgi:catechol 2,3-dioxygenase-like lactoylglutathione lyase family enzyme